MRSVPHNPHSHRIWASLNKTHSCCGEGIWGSSLFSPLNHHLLLAGAALLIPGASLLISQPDFPSREKITTGLWVSSESLPSSIRASVVTAYIMLPVTPAWRPLSPGIPRGGFLFNWLTPTCSCFVVSGLVKVGLLPFLRPGFSLFLVIYSIAAW